jgi:hypothetical protein
VSTKPGQNHISTAFAVRAEWQKVVNERTLGGSPLGYRDLEIVE